MGGGNWSDQTYSSIKTDYSTKTAKDIFASKMHDDMNPKGLKFRESRDSVDHPESLAVAFLLDVTGSMGEIPEHLIKNKLGNLMNTLIKHGLKDSHLLFGAIGDQYSDRAPLQVGQFEAETTKLDKCLTDIFIEGRGGGGGRESYPLAWLFAARHTSIDCFEKRGIKGFLFTAGDEMYHPKIDASVQEEFLGYTQADDLNADDLLLEAQRSYHVFHLYIPRGADNLSWWKSKMGENVIPVDDTDNIAEIVASTVAVIHGADVTDVVKDFDAKTAGSVTRALANIKKGDVARNGNTGLMAL